MGRQFEEELKGNSMGRKMLQQVTGQLEKHFIPDGAALEKTRSCLRKINVVLEAETPPEGP